MDEIDYRALSGRDFLYDVALITGMIISMRRNLDEISNVAFGSIGFPILQRIPKFVSTISAAYNGNRN